MQKITADDPLAQSADIVAENIERDFQDNIRNDQMLTGQVDSDGRKMTSNSEASSRFHTDWLNMKCPDHIRDDRSEEDVHYELLLKLGLDLCTPIEARVLDHERHEPHEKGATAESTSFRGLRAFCGSTASGSSVVHSIGAGTLIACLATTISRDEVEELAQGIIAWHKEQAPSGETTIVFRDSAFADDVARTNLTAILQQHGLANVRSL